MMKRVAYKSIDETRLSVQITDQEKRTCCLKYGQNRQSVKGRQKRPTDRSTNRPTFEQTDRKDDLIDSREGKTKYQENEKKSTNRNKAIYQ